MRQKKYRFFKCILMIIIPLLGLVSCKNDDTESNVQSKIEIYLLKSYKTASNSKAIRNDSIVLNDTALIRNSEILWYDQTNCTFKISDNKAKWLNDFQTNATHGRAFAVTIDKIVIYTGYFWAGFSSSSVDWIVVDPLNYGGDNTLTVQLGYPGLMPHMAIPDLRNDKRIIDLLRSTNRLKK